MDWPDYLRGPSGRVSLRPSYGLCFALSVPTCPYTLLKNVPPPTSALLPFRTATSARRYGLGIPNLPAAKTENLASCTASSATQCGSNPVSGGGLPKTRIFQVSAGD